MNTSRNNLRKSPPGRLGRRLVIASASTLSLSIGLIGLPRAEAATVYRCGADFRQYSQTPCEGGRELEVADDSRNAEQVRQGQDAARHHARAERDLARDLRELERHPPAAGSLSPRQAASQTHAAPSRPSSKRQKQGREGGTRALPPDSFKAIDPNSVGAKKRATKSKPKHD